MELATCANLRVMMILSLVITASGLMIDYLITRKTLHLYISIGCFGGFLATLCNIRAPENEAVPAHDIVYASVIPTAPPHPGTDIPTSEKKLSMM